MANVNLVESNDISITQSDNDILLNVKKDSAVSTSSTKAVENQAITNYVNDLISFTETEQRVGTWIDGKPLYRKVFTISNPQSTNTNYEDISSLNIKIVTHLYGYYKNSTGTFEIPFYDSDTNYSVIFVSSGGYIRGRFGTPSGITEAKVILEYTKTTD